MSFVSKHQIGSFFDHTCKTRRVWSTTPGRRPCTAIGCAADLFGCTKRSGRGSFGRKKNSSHDLGTATSPRYLSEKRSKNHFSCDLDHRGQSWRSAPKSPKPGLPRGHFAGRMTGRQVTGGAHGAHRLCWRRLRCVRIASEATSHFSTCLALSTGLTGLGS